VVIAGKALWKQLFCIVISNFDEYHSSCCLLSLLRNSEKRSSDLQQDQRADDLPTARRSRATDGRFAVPVLRIWLTLYISIWSFLTFLLNTLSTFLTHTHIKGQTCHHRRPDHCVLGGPVHTRSGCRREHVVDARDPYSGAAIGTDRSGAGPPVRPSPVGSGPSRDPPRTHRPLRVRCHRIHGSHQPVPGPEALCLAQQRPVPAMKEESKVCCSPRGVYGVFGWNAIFS
jgi:hypothetical protein